VGGGQMDEQQPLENKRQEEEQTEVARAVTM
jgi:hypothetical protein